MDMGIPPKRVLLFAWSNWGEPTFLGEANVDKVDAD